MVVVAAVTTAFIIIGDINMLAPIVTMPFLLTYACIDYAYFALAQTFDIRTKREERFRIQAQSPSYESGQHDERNDNDLDHLFPERVRHKVGDQSNTVQPSKQTPLLKATTTNTIESHPPNVTERGSFSNRSSVDTTTDNNVQIPNVEDEPIVQPNAAIQSKPKNWYSNLCNRWVSLFGAIIKIIIMMLVNGYYGIACLGIVFIVWFYVGTLNPAVKPGIASEFRFFVWLKGVIFRCFG